MHVRVVSVNDVRAPGGALGRQVVRATALESFKGPIVAQQVFTLVVLGQRPTLDPARPSVPYFAADKTSEHVLFLERGAQAHAWSLQTLFDLDGRPGGEHLAVVRLVAAWSAMAEPRAKAARIVKDLLRLLTSGGAWSKTYAARELAWLAESRPESFDTKSRRTLQRIAPIGTSRDQRFWTRRALECLVPKEKGEREEAPERDPWRQAFLEAGDTDVRVRLLTKLHASSGTLYDRHAWWAWRRLEPSLRTWFLDALVESKRSGSSADLRRAYGVEDDAETRERIVRALGYLGDDRDVPWLTERVANERLRRSALLALSRIATPAARKALEAAQGEPWADADMAAWIDHLLGRPIPGTSGQGGG
ncbi:MAG: HEAT repeat domain-containing protein [Planctomycetota bacterium]|nr:HEAT repeat domain-containing protein [Planctomycetota bacterium]